nr:hypothetical protein Iba_chr14aCG0140 [Ipomoea batatas]
MLTWMDGRDELRSSETEIEYRRHERVLEEDNVDAAAGGFRVFSRRPSPPLPFLTGASASEAAEQPPENNNVLLLRLAGGFFRAFSRRPSSPLPFLIGSSASEAAAEQPPLNNNALPLRLGGDGGDDAYSRNVARGFCTNRIRDEERRALMMMTMTASRRWVEYTPPRQGNGGAGTSGGHAAAENRRGFVGPARKPSPHHIHSLLPRGS